MLQSSQEFDSEYMAFGPFCLHSAVTATFLLCTRGALLRGGAWRMSPPSKRRWTNISYTNAVHLQEPLTGPERAFIQFYLAIWCYLALTGGCRFSSGHARPRAFAHRRGAIGD